MHVMCDICTERRRNNPQKNEKKNKTKTNTFQVQDHKIRSSVVQVKFRPASSPA